MGRAAWVLLAFLTSLPAQELLRQADALIEREDWPAAEQLLQKQAAASPADTDIAYRLGYVQFRRRNLAGARLQFRKVVTAAPPAHNSRYFLGRIALLENKPAEAVTWLEPVARAGDSPHDADSQLAQAYAALGQTAKALPHIEAAIRQAPWDGGLYYRLGRLRQQAGQPELARQALAESARLKDASREDVESLTALSLALERGEIASANERSAAILDRPDADPAVLVAAGLLWARASDSLRALDAFERAALRDANGFASQFNYGVALLRANRAADALAPLTRAVELLPQSPEANLSLGLAAVSIQRYEEAKAPLSAAARLQPGNLRLLALLATAHLRTGSAAEAVQVLTAANVIEKATDPPPVLLLIEALLKANQAERALEVASRLAQRFPAAPLARMALAQQLARAGQYQAARPEFEQVLQLAPGQLEASLGLADTLQKAGEHAAAIPHYRAALGAPALGVAVPLGLARSLAATRQLAEARAVLEQARDRFPNEAPLRVELSRIYARLGERQLAAQEAAAIEALKEPKP